MSRNQNGTYFLPDGNPVLPGELITAEWANATLEDVANALTDSLDRDGKGGMRAPFRNVDGTQATPAISFAAETGTGFYREADGVMTGVVKGKRAIAVRETGVEIPGSLSAASLAGEAATGAGASGTWNINITGTSGNGLPAGTCMPFAQEAAPTGWTQVTDDSANNRMLRVVASPGGGTGGVHDPVLNNVVPSHTHGFTTGGESADHSHFFNANTNEAGWHGHSLPGDVMTQAGGSGPFFTGDNWLQYSIIHDTNGAGNHAHNVQGWTGGVNTNHTHSGGTDNGSSQTNWTPRYIDMIICAKN